MANKDVLNALYERRKSPIELYFDNLSAPPILSLITVQDISYLNKIARSIKYTIDEKYKLIDNIMTFRGFVKLHAGTNRVVYRFLEDQRFVMKIAIDRVGLNDNPAEFKNQFLLKPFVTKVFEVSPCGTVGLFERVDAIMSREEFISVADDVFNLITKFFVGQYILEDFGSHYFMNWGCRHNGFGLVLLDFPYVYELDGNRLFCNAKLIPGDMNSICGGELDYDDGFNNLICTKCGRQYQAKDLEKAKEKKLIIVGGKKNMRVQIKLGSKIIHDSYDKKVLDTIPENPKELEYETTIVETKTNEDNNVVEGKNVVVQARVDDTINNQEDNITKPTDAIFNKDNSDNVDYDDNYENETDYDYLDDGEELEYSQYLKNRDKKDNKGSYNKYNKRKFNKDFSDF